LEGKHVNAIEQARKAYAPTHSPIRSNRSIEYQAFSEIISRMREAATGETANFPKLVAALQENRSLWTILAADVADPDNTLPQALRAQIFYLAEFTDLHTRKVLRGNAEITPLIDINTAVMRGLGQATGPARAGERVN